MAFLSRLPALLLGATCCVGAIPLSACSTPGPEPSPGASVAPPETREALAEALAETGEVGTLNETKYCSQLKGCCPGWLRGGPDCASAVASGDEATCKRYLKPFCSRVTKCYSAKCSPNQGCSVAYSKTCPAPVPQGTANDKCLLISCSAASCSAQSVPCASDPPVTGSCTRKDGKCSSPVAKDACTDGAFVPGGTCAKLGVCDFPQACVVNVDSASCAAKGGTFMTSCPSVSCDFGNGECRLAPKNQCQNIVASCEPPGGACDFGTVCIPNVSAADCLLKRGKPRPTCSP